MAENDIRTGESPETHQDAERSTTTSQEGGPDVANPNRSEDELQNEVNSLKSDLTKVQGDLREIADTLIHMGRDSATQARERATQQWETSQDTIQQYVEERPMAVVAGAFVAGLVLGMLFGRR